MNKTVKYTIFMILIGFVISLLLALVNEFTKPIIENQKLEKVKESLLEVDNINKWQSYNTDINDETIEQIYVSVNENDNSYKFYAYLINTKGYSSGNIKSLIFIDNANKVINSVKIISIENQTKGIGSLVQDDPNYVLCFKDQNINKYINDNESNHTSDSIDVISGATISSRAVIEAVINACNNYNLQVSK